MEVNCPCPKYLPFKLTCGVTQAAKSKRTGTEPQLTAGILSHLWAARYFHSEISPYSILF